MRLLKPAFILSLLIPSAAFPASKLDQRLKKDPVARQVREVLLLGFADLKQDLAQHPETGCASLEKAQSDFGPMLYEYTVRTSDSRFNQQLRAWFLKFCGREPGSPGPADAD